MDILDVSELIDDVDPDDVTPIDADDVDYAVFVRQLSKLTSDTIFASDGLSPREIRVLFEHTFDERTLREIGDDLGVSVERVRTIRANAAAKLRNAVVSRLRMRGFDLDATFGADSVGRQARPYRTASIDRCAEAANALRLRRRVGHTDHTDRLGALKRLGFAQRLTWLVHSIDHANRKQSWAIVRAVSPAEAVSLVRDLGFEANAVRHVHPAVLSLPHGENGATIADAVGKRGGSYVLGWIHPDVVDELCPGLLEDFLTPQR
jgi:DNA-binding CsgD family transcriptional regulator